MSEGVGYALLSLLAAGVLDVVFGRYSGRHRVTGAYLVATGVIIIAGQSLALAVTRAPLAVDAGAALWGTLICLVATFLLLGLRTC